MRYLNITSQASMKAQLRFGIACVARPSVILLNDVLGDGGRNLRPPRCHKEADLLRQNGGARPSQRTDHEKNL